MIQNNFLYLLIVLSFFCFDNSLAQQVSQNKLSGGELFNEKRCVRCHTVGRGRFVGPDLYGISKRYSRDEVIKWIINPNTIYEERKKMPVNDGYPPMPRIDVNSGEANAIADYLIGFKKVDKPLDGGAIKGRVVNRSTGLNVGNIDVFLRSFIGDKEVSSDLRITDDNGYFEFDKLAWTNSYSISIKHTGVGYETDKMVFMPKQSVIELNLPVFNTTENDEDILVLLNHIIVSSEKDSLSFIEIYEFENRSKNIFIGTPSLSDKRKTIGFVLPESAKEISFIEGVLESVKDGSVLYDISGFQPGKKRVVLTYKVPPKFKIDKKVLYPTSKILLLANNSIKSLNVNGLNKIDSVSVDEGTYLRWFGEEFSSNSAFSIEVKGVRSLNDFLKYIPLLVFGTFILVALFLIVNNKD